MGHPVVSVTLVLFTCWLGYRYWLGVIEPTAVLIVGVIALSAAKANQRYSAYQQWKLEWSLMGGHDPRVRVSPRAFKNVLGIASWFGLLALALNNAHPELRWAVALFWFATMVMVLAAAYRWWRARRRPNRPREVAVSVRLAKPLRSPSLSEAYAALPDHCRAMLARRPGA